MAKMEGPRHGSNLGGGVGKKRSREKSLFFLNFVQVHDPPLWLTTGKAKKSLLRFWIFFFSVTCIVLPFFASYFQKAFISPI